MIDYRKSNDWGEQLNRIRIMEEAVLPYLGNGTGNLALNIDADGVIYADVIPTGGGGLTDISGLITEGTNVTITGSGTSGDPYVINSSGGGGGLSGTLTVGNIPYPTSASAFTRSGTGTNGMWWDEPNMRLGLNDDSPTYTLDVNGVVRATSSIISDGSLNVSSQLYQSGVYQQGTASSPYIRYINNWASTGSFEWYGKDGTLPLLRLNGTGSGTVVLPTLAGLGSGVLSIDNSGNVGWLATPSGGTPAGSTREVQFNNAGAFGASSNLIFNTDGELLIGGITDVGAYPLQVAGGFYFRHDAGNVLYYTTTNGLQMTSNTTGGRFTITKNFGSSPGFELSNSGGGFIRMGGGSGTGFLPYFEMRPDGSTQNRNFFRAKATDTGATAVLQLDATQNNDTALATKPLLAISNALTDRFIITPAGIITLSGYTGTGNQLAYLSSTGVLTRSSIDISKLSYTLNTNITPVGNSTSTPTDLMTYTVPAGLLAADGDSISFSFGYVFAANANSKTVATFLGTDSGPSITTTQTGDFIIEGTITRLTSTTIRWVVKAGGGSTGDFVLEGTETLSGALVLKTVGTAVATDDIIQRFAKTVFLPA